MPIQPPGPPTYCCPSFKSYCRDNGNFIQIERFWNEEFRNPQPRVQLCKGDLVIIHRNLDCSDDGFFGIIVEFHYNCIIAYTPRGRLILQYSEEVIRVRVTGLTKHWRGQLLNDAIRTGIIKLDFELPFEDERQRYRETRQRSNIKDW